MRRGTPLWTGLVLATLGALTPAPARAAGCAAAEYRQFDFWVGEWTVKNPDGTPAGSSSVTRELDGCVIHEHWQGQGGFDGQSFNHYEAAAKGWRQVWVDNTGREIAMLDGHFADGRMVLEGVRATPQGERRNRISWSQIEGGGVRQLWESSLDNGKTWQVQFDGRYSRR